MDGYSFSNTDLPCVYCGHINKEHTGRWDYTTKQTIPKINKAKLFWICRAKFCECKEWKGMDNLDFVQWKRWGNLFFLMRRKGKL